MENWDEGYNTQKLLSITKKKQKTKEPSKNRSILLHMCEMVMKYTTAAIYVMLYLEKAAAFELMAR